MQPVVLALVLLLAACRTPPWDARLVDLGVSPQSSTVDLATPDLEPAADLALPDLSLPDLTPPSDLRPPADLAHGPPSFAVTDYALSLNWLGGALAAGDFDRDGRIDLAVCTEGPVARVGVMLGDGDGSFRAVPAFYDAADDDYEGGENRTRLAVGDFNGDGKLDAVATMVEGTNGAGLLLGNGDGSFQPRTNLGDYYRGVAAGDFDGDGRLDLAFGEIPAGQSQGSVVVRRGNGDGTFQPADSFAIPGEPMALGAADFDGDGALDIVASDSNTANGDVTLLRRSQGRFLAPATFTASHYVDAFTVGDFNGDGWPDVVTATDYSGEMAVLLNDGAGGLGAPLKLPGIGLTVGAADFDGDGKLDLAVASLDGVHVRLGDGHGSFASPDFLFPVAGIAAELVVADFNGDGRPDIAVSVAKQPHSVAVLLNR